MSSRSGRGSPSMLNSTGERSGASCAAMADTSQRVMCRSSARGWMVMPGAPALMQTRIASVGEGSEPPRELRSGATLLMFTDTRRPAPSASLAPSPGPPLLARLAETLFHGLGNLLRPALDLLLIASFDHHHQQGLRARVAG